MKQYLRATIQSMSENKILSMVDNYELSAIKVVDPHPVIRAYVVGHEGEASFRLPEQGIGAKTFKWVRDAVGWLHDKITVGIQVFNQHGNTNSHEGRKAVGRVVGKKLTETENGVTTIAAMYIYPEYRHLPLDIASIEADIEFRSDDGGQSYPVNVQNITGIALSNSEVHQPGFPGATFLGAVAAFNQIQGVSKVTKEEIKEGIKTLNLKPTDVFELTTIVTDNPVVDHIKKEKHDVYNQNQRLQEEVTTLRDKVVKTTEDYEGKVKVLQSEAMLGKAGPIIDRVVTGRKYTDQQVKFAKSHLSRFSTKSTNEEGLEEDVKKFLDTEMDDMKAAGELFGVKMDEGGEKPDNKDIKKPRKPEPEFDDIDEGGVADDDNPLVPGSKADLEYEGG